MEPSKKSIIGNFLQSPNLKEIAAFMVVACHYQKTLIINKSVLDLQFRNHMTHTQAGYFRQQIFPTLAFAELSKSKKILIDFVPSLV